MFLDAYEMYLSHVGADVSCLCSLKTSQHDVLPILPVKFHHRPVKPPDAISGCETGTDWPINRPMGAVNRPLRVF